MKVRLQNDWPDYVFSKNYKKLPLEDLERFVQTNKHLPDIPSAIEQEKEGLDLGEMNIKLLKKIEDLILYIIEQSGEIKEEKLRNMDQQERLNKLEKILKVK